MAIKLELKPELEASLAARAQAEGIPLDTYLQRVLEELALEARTPAASLEEFRATLDALAEGGAQLPPLPSAAFTRDSIYRDHD